MHTILERLSGGFAAELKGLKDAETQLRPAGRPGAWTIQQIVEHLMLSYESTAETMRVRLARGSATKAKASPANLVAQFTVARLGYFPAGREAPEMVQPRPDAPPVAGTQLWQEFATSLGAMDALLAEVERVLGHGRAVSHALLGPMSVANWRRFHLAHGRHHLKQVRQILVKAPVDVSR